MLTLVLLTVVLMTAISNEEKCEPAKKQEQEECLPRLMLRL